MAGLYRQFFLLALIASAAAAHAQPNLRDRAERTRCSWALENLSHIDRDFYRFRLSKITSDILSASAGKIDPLELDAVLHLRDFLSVPILLAPDIGQHKSTPGFDAVLYDHYGIAYSNVSIKSIDVSKLTHGNITQTMRSARASARAQLLRVYDLKSFLKQNGFVLDDDGAISPRKGLPHQIRAASRMQYYINLFGLNLEQPRKTSVLINVFNSDQQSGAFQPRFELRQHNHGKWRSGHRDQYLFMENMNGRTSEFGANLSHLSENLISHEHISEYIFMTPTQVLVIRADEIIIKDIAGPKLRAP